MNRRVLAVILVLVLAASIAPMSAFADTSSYPPYAKIEYGYSSDVVYGTIRYISQIPGDSYFSWNYWPSSAFGEYSSPTWECGTASISMALSYIGVNKTPSDILVPYNGVTQFIDWGAGKHSSPSLSTAISNYLNGNGKYSPVVIHIPYYVGNGHFLLIIGKISSNTYQMLDPNSRKVTTATINGTSMTYNIGGGDKTENIDGVHQWYNANATPQEHTCNMNEFAYNEADHPHYKCYKCSICGKVQRNSNEPTLLNTCDACRPGKPELQNMQETYPENKEITFAWNNTDRTTHYNLWLDKLNENNEWETVEQIFYAKSGLTRELQPGHYRAQLLSYNSDLYEPDGSDWYHTWSNDCYFAVTHNYVVSEDIPASCTEYARTTYTCTLCGDHYTEYKDASYSDWSTTKPAGVDEELIESRTEYRYSDYETKTSDASELSGWTKTGSDWEKTGSGTIDYVDSWPSGFSTNSALYRQYNNTPKSASETSTAKTTVSASNGGYLYYHWCRGNYTGGPINRKTSPNYTSEFGSFHAFYSDTAPGSLGSASDDGSYVYANASCCTDSHWYYPVAVTRQSYTTYKKVFTYSRWTAWSDWSAQARTSSDTRKVETRTAYRYLQVQMDEHKWDDGVISVPATCAAEGTKTYTCTVCKATKTEPIAKQAHDYRQTVVAATCTAKGYTLNKCSRCGDEYRDAETEMLPHAYVNGVCTVCGNKVFLIRPTAVTAVAGATVTVPVEIWNNAGFAGFTFQITSDPSLVLTGIKRGAMLEAAGNGLFTVNIKKGIINWTGDCNITGNGVILELTFTIADNVSDGEYEVSVACKGNEASNCVDEHSQPVAVTFEPGTVTVTKAPHVHSYKAVVTAPTCTSKGYTTHTCACGDSYVDTYVDALGHAWDEGKVTKEPTETETGVKTFTCTRCGETKTETIPKLTHEHSYKAVVTAPTCTEKGYTTHTCACGDSYVDTYVDALGHAWDEGKVTKPATEAEDGVKTFTCTRCGETKTETIPKLTHEHSYKAVVTAPTCTAKGYTTHTCACGDSYVDTYVDALGHAWDAGKVTEAPTETKTGVKTFTCTRCGETKTETIPVTNCPSAVFTDVQGGDHWAHEGIDYCIANGLMSGIGGNLFAPKLTTTRAQIVQILYNPEGEPKVSGTTPFTDLTQDWYQDAVLWAYQTGVVAGTSSTTFEPDLPVTREQIAVILMEYMTRVLKLERTWTPADLSTFPDAGSVSDWAKDAMADAVGLGLISGASNGGQTYLEPQGSATREQVATILMEFCKNVKK